MPQQLFQLSPDSYQFPDPAHALTDPNGLLAVGGDLHPQRLLSAYQDGIFPWFDANSPLLWWSPNPRAVLLPEEVHISRSMRKFFRHSDIEISINTAFNKIIEQCALPRKHEKTTWITQAMMDAYNQLHQQGHAHSIEVWDQDELVGGLYGLAIGRVFCGESMFHTKTNASKAAFIFLCQHWQQHGGQLIDCQISNTHLQSLGAMECTRDIFLQTLHALRDKPIHPDCWRKPRADTCMKSL